MLPPAHVAYTWLALTLAQDTLRVATDADYRLVAAAAMGPDLVDKPLAWAYFYRKHRSAVLFAHTLLAFLALVVLTARRFPRLWVYTAAFAGHAILDRLWFYPDTFYWPLRGWRFHVWRKQGSEQEEIGKAYWFAFTRRPELWGWELGGLLALAWLVWRHRLYRPRRLLAFLLSGRPPG
ncbi:MAG TPA: metal-dependent hydrolase [Caldilineaceae bacterium]|nr:metal-dependent hydrolase [Caldilineaceae bacterium]